MMISAMRAPGGCSVDAPRVAQLGLGGNAIVPTIPAMTRAIGFLIFPDFQILDAAGPMAAFEIAGRYEPGAYAIKTIAAVAGPVRSSAGVCLEAAGLDDPATYDTLMLAGGEGTREAADDPRLLAF